MIRHLSPAGNLSTLNMVKSELLCGIGLGIIDHFESGESLNIGCTPFDVEQHATGAHVQAISLSGGVKRIYPVEF